MSQYTSSLSNENPNIFVDLRSDTVTKPCHVMKHANILREYGDDVYQEDTTTQELEKKIALLFNKDDALFFPTGTMANLTAVMVWANKRGSEIILGNNSHIFLFEQGGASFLGGVAYHTLPNEDDGTISLDAIKNAIREDDIHEPNTSLICIENTHNACGGRVLPFSYLTNLRKLANKECIPIHLDGARLWNALEYGSETPGEIANCVDSISVCLSKGLGSPMGSLLIGNKEFIKKARRIRKALGGGMRQTGFITSAGLIALQNFHKGILKEDHEKTLKLASAIDKLSKFEIVSKVETNIFFFKSLSSSYSDKEIMDFLNNYHVRISLWDINLFRIVVHKDVSAMNIDFVISVFIKLNQLSAN